MQHDKTWIVTGGSKGLGLALVRTLLARGYRVAATSRSLRDVSAAVEPNERFLPLAMDPADESSVARAIAAVRDTFGTFDVVVNNAGYGQLGAVEEVSDAEARRTSFLTESSLARPSRSIAAYASARASEVQHTMHINGHQPGDPEKAARALVATYEASEPPLHLFLGSDAVAMAEKKLSEVQSAIATHRDVSTSTDY